MSYWHPPIREQSLLHGWKLRNNMGTKTKQKFASELPYDSEALRMLIYDRITHDVCLECGGPRVGSSSFCVKCLADYPRIENVGEPVDGWQYRIRLNYPAYM